MIPFSRGELHDFDLELDAGNWSALPPGEVLRHLERSPGVRPPATAMSPPGRGSRRRPRRGPPSRRNPIALIVPCHRVIRADGTTGGYGGKAGTALKQRLLDLERS